MREISAGRIETRRLSEEERKRKMMTAEHEIRFG